MTKHRIGILTNLPNGEMVNTCLGDLQHYINKMVESKEISEHWKAVLDIHISTIHGLLEHAANLKVMDAYGKIRGLRN